ncbi:MAG: ABC transporter permease, partial [Coriobacteriia bacterium]|nr:ABC transporter permease [Coriobacteriia bacterium]
QVASPVARVSVGAGAWLVLVGGAVVWFAGTRGPRSTLLGPAAAVAVTASLVMSVAWGGLGDLSLAREYVAQSERFWQLVREHLVLSGAGLGLGALIGVPLGVAASRSRVVREVGLGVAGIIQTVPSLALLGLLVLPLAALGLPGIGTLPAVIALTLYALLPIVRNTYVGLAGVDAGALDAGRGMGMSRTQLLVRIEAPLALPLLLEGVRASAVLVIGIAAVTAFVGAGGLGVLVFLGWGQQADDLTLLGALPMVALALLVDVGMRLVARAIVSPGIREVGA